MIRFSSLLLILLMAPFVSSAGSVQEACGVRASAIERLFTDVESIRLKCIDDYFVAQKEANAKMAQQVSEEIEKQKEILKKSAYKADDRLFRVHCDFPAEIENSKSRTEQCRKDLALYNGLVTQLDHIMGWDRIIVKPSQGTAEQVQKELQVPCPDQETLTKIQPVRYFKKNLYKIYERCQVLSN